MTLVWLTNVGIRPKFWAKITPIKITTTQTKTKLLVLTTWKTSNPLFVGTKYKKKELWETSPPDWGFKGQGQKGGRALRIAKIAV